MKHGAGFRKLSKKSSHRLLMLRNLVTSLLEHEQIKTTLPKARETARLAEKIITLGKNGDETSFRQATSFILKPHVLPKLFTSLRERYSNRPGGYTRIHKYGNRQGDNAPHAIIELVDNPRDLKVEMTAKAVGWELLARRIREDDSNPRSVDIDKVMDAVRSVAENSRAKGVPLRDLTKRNLSKVLKFQGEDGMRNITKKTGLHMARLLAQPDAFDGLRRVVEVEKDDEKKLVYRGFTARAGQRLAGMTTQATSLRLAKGALGKSAIQGSSFWEKRTKLGVRVDSQATS